MKKILYLPFCVLIAGMSAKAAQVDLGITLGEVLGNSGVLSNARVELGTFSGYADSTGAFNASYFIGKDYATLRGSYTSILNIDSPQVTGTDGSGFFYGAFDMAATPTNTRLFAWIHSTSAPSSSAAWAVITGGGNLSGPNASAYDANWLAVAPSAGEINVIEAATIYSQIAASSSGVSLLPNSLIDSEGVNISLVPEPTSSALMIISAVGLVALRRLRKV